MLGATDQHIGGIWRDHEFQRPKCNHIERHAPRVAPYGVVKEISLPAVGLVRNAVLQDFSILGRQRGFLPEPPRLCLVERRLSSKPGDDKARPRALPVGILRLVGGFGAADRQRRDRDGCDQTATMHRNLPHDFGPRGSLHSLFCLSTWGLAKPSGVFPLCYGHRRRDPEIGPGYRGSDMPARPGALKALRKTSIFLN